MSAQLFHSSLKGYTGSCGGLLEDHSQSLALHERRIVAGLDALLDLQGKVDDVKQFFLCEIHCVDEVSYAICIHSCNLLFLLYIFLFG